MTHARVTYIGLDLGTSALKGVLADDAGRILRTAKRPVIYDRPDPGHVENDPLAHWHDVAGLIRELAAASPAPVHALALSGASGNTLLTDAAGAALLAAAGAGCTEEAAATPPHAREIGTPERTAGESTIIPHKERRNESNGS